MHRQPRLLAIAAAIALVLPVAKAIGQGVNTMPVADEFDRLHFRSIGPATMSGRIADFAVYEPNTAIFYVGTSHGGVWKTTSNGAIFTPLLQEEALLSIGSVAVSQKTPDLVWVGTGESNNRQSTSWGDGIYKSTDGGKTWKNMGLRNSKHIGRIVIDPNDNDIVLVAAAGPLFGSGGDRGVYKTADGGATWKRVLSVDDETGANDIVQSQVNPRVLYASTYQRRRTACCVNGGGPGSGIWKSTDEGETWTRLSGSGLPNGPLGRIALSMFRRNQNTIYALIEGPSGGGRGGAGGAAGGGGGGGFGGGGPETGIYRTDDGGATWTKQSGNNPRPLYFSQVRVDPNSPDRVYVGGVKMSFSIDGGKTFVSQASLVAHDDIHAIWVDPNNSDHVLIGGDGGVYQSYDMSKTWTYMPNLPVGLFYHVSYDMEIPYNICGGMQDNYDWCGPSASHQVTGIMNYDWFQVQGGDGFESIPDLRDPRIVYTESQDGNLIRRNKVTGESKSIRPTPANVTNSSMSKETSYRFQWDTPVMLSPNDPGTLLVGANHLFRSTDRGDSWEMISPDLTSNADRDTIVTMGLKGSDINISRNDGISQWPALISIAESPKQPGLYYTGTDDGTLSMSRDGGKNWSNITSRLPGFPAGAFVSEVVPSRYDAGTVYVTVDNHRLNDYDTHMWVSNDFGATFRSMNGNLKGENVRTLTEDQRNPDVLYIGTESGLFLSLDRGKSWRRLHANFPTVRVDEITLHPRDNAMIVATHGRVLWILDHLEPIQEYTAAQTASGDAKLFTIPTGLEWKSKDDRNDEFWGNNYFIGENPPFDAMIQMNVKKPLTNPSLHITDAAGHVVRDVAITAEHNKPGIQTVCWDLRVEPIANAEESGGRGARGGGGGAGGGGRGGPEAIIPGVPTPLPTPGYKPENQCGEEVSARGGGGLGGGAGVGPHVLPGSYTVALMADGKTIDSRTMKVVMDPLVQFTDAQRRRYNDIVTDLHEMQRRATATAQSLNALYPQMEGTSTKLKDMSNVPADVKAQFDAFSKEFDGVREKFGVPLGAAGGRGGRGGGGRGGAPLDPNNVLGRTAALKTQMLAIWEMPSDALMRQYAQIKQEMPKAMADATTLLGKGPALSQALKKYDVTLNVSSVQK